MNFELKFKSIASRWLFNVYLPIVLAVVILAVALSSIYSSYYTDRVERLANDYTYDFDSLSECDEKTFHSAAVTLTENYAHKALLEVQITDASGKVFLSTTGFEPADITIPEFSGAAGSDGGYASYRGKSSSGEEIFSGTHIIYGKNGETLGAYRWITSLEAVRRNIAVFIILLCALCAAALGISALSGLFFIKSIVRPIRDVSNTARKIAAGDLEAKIDIKKNDEIGELCDTINYMATELKQAENMKNDFISSVSHELRTPLTAIRGWGETAKMSVGSDDELVSRGLDVVLSEAERLSGLVEDLLDFSRMQSGRLTVNPAPVEIADPLESAVDMYIELAKKQGIELSYTPSSMPAVVLGDADRLKQVFVNVIDNAVKYTEKGGLVLVLQTREEGCVRIIVKDTGVGIPAQDIDRVKEKFFKSNKTVRGSGIGLAVADEIIRQHQGLLFLESTEGTGTTVTIVLPLYEEEKSEAAPADALPLAEFETAQPVETQPESGETESDDSAETAGKSVSGEQTAEDGDTAGESGGSGEMSDSKKENDNGEG